MKKEKLRCSNCNDRQETLSYDEDVVMVDADSPFSEDAQKKKGKSTRSAADDDDNSGNEDEAKSVTIKVPRQEEHHHHYYYNQCHHHYHYNQYHHHPQPFSPYAPPAITYNSMYPLTCYSDLHHRGLPGIPFGYQDPPLVIYRDQPRRLKTDSTLIEVDNNSPPPPSPPKTTTTTTSSNKSTANTTTPPINKKRPRSSTSEEDHDHVYHHRCQPLYQFKRQKHQNNQ